MGKLIDLTGQKFGKLTVLQRAPYCKSGHIYWTCWCECGNIKDICGNNLRNGVTTSCGCLQKINTSKANRKDISNQQFGKLTALYCTNKKDSGGRYIWHCICDCGNTIDVSIGQLTSGLTSSCGCLRSKGETIIADLLTQYHIRYQREYHFENSKRRFDFAIFNKQNQLIRLIEFDGIQHYIDLGEVWDKDRPLIIRQQIDKEKNQLAFQHHIPIIRIPYWKLKQLTIIQLLDETFLVKEE